jgi:hypothetical protein
MGKGHGKDRKRTVFFYVIHGMVGNFSLTLPAPKIGGAPFEELQEKVRVELIFMEWSESNLVEHSAPKQALKPP